MAFIPRRELLWNFREDVCFRAYIEPADELEFIRWVKKQASHFYSRDVWEPCNHLLKMAGREKGTGRLCYDVFCPDMKFKTLVKLAWGGK